MSEHDRREETDSPETELADLLSAASRFPGVEDLMRVSRHFRQYEPALKAHQRYVGVYRTSVASDSSHDPFAKKR